jgi:hypothetical protein
LRFWIDSTDKSRGGYHQEILGHRQTISYGQSPNLSLLPREALAREISDARAIYRRQGLYTPQIRRSLQQVIQSNKLAWLGVFEKGVNR